MFLGLSPSPEKSVLRCEVLTSAQMREADRLTIAAGTPGYELMTAAGQSVANIVHEHYPDHAVLVLCGPGNNGGDGFVAARFLQDMGHMVTVMSLVPGRKFAGDAKAALRDWGGKPLGFSDRPAMPEQTVVVDAVFGTGLARGLQSPVTELFADVRQAGWPVVAVDIPSGINGDTGEADSAALPATHTVTFFRKKVGHVLMPGQELCGQITVHDIGIADDVLALTGFALRENEAALWAGRLPKPQSSGHKYSRGHVAVLGGVSMTGAARMVSEAAMRTGAGLCTIIAGAEAATVYQRGAAHILYEPLAGFAAFGKHFEDKRRNVAVLGPGAGLEDREGLQQAVLAALATGRPVVLDADALTCFGADSARLYAALHEKAVLTPHEGEFARLFPALEGGRLVRAEQAAQMTRAVILFKGSDTILAQAGRGTVVNTHATPWLATAGAGDVLAGIIGGLMAQGMEPFDAACAGAWIHGEAGERKGPGLVAPDIIAEIPAVLRDFA